MSEAKNQGSAERSEAGSYIFHIVDKALDFGARENKLEEVVEKIDKLKKTIPKPLKKALKWLFGHLKEKIYRIVPKNKGSLKDPFLYLGVISVILLSILSFTSHHLWLEVNSIVIAKNLNASLVNPNNQPENGREPFVGPIKNSLEESPDFVLIQKSSLVAFSPPILVTPQVLGSIFGDSESELGATTREGIIEYTVQSGDTLTSIAAHFGVSLNTLLWANDLNQKSTIKPGQTLIILPVSGVIHHVKNGDTTAEIAKRYKGDVDKIIAFNNLSEEGDIFIGDILIIPDGIIPQVSIKQATTKKSSSEIPLASSYFLYPVPSSYAITQGLHWYNAVDIGNGTCGGPVYAAAGGEVQKTGYDGTAGKFIRILHFNNVVTFYGHLSGILVSPGEKISQGQIIGYIGNTGYTKGQTGCHLHFGVHGAINPFAR